jgi:4-amino-4-deoxy-L-arabinose transferase-like glycosyltransferase
MTPPTGVEGFAGDVKPLGIRENTRGLFSKYVGCALSPGCPAPEKHATKDSFLRSAACSGVFCRCFWKEHDARRTRRVPGVGGRTVTGRLQPIDSFAVAAANPSSCQPLSNAPTRSAALASAAPSALAALIFFFNLWRYGLWEPDEARYAEIAREMVSGGSLVIPHLNYVIYVEKPPLLYWFTSLSFAIFGISEFAARLFVALFGVIGVAATAWFAARCFGKRHALLSGGILATIPLYATMAQVLTTDVMLTTFVTIANFALFLHWRESGRWCWLGYGAIAFGVLTKGPVAIILPVVALLAFLIWERDWRGVIARFRVLGGLGLVVVISAPWFITMIVRVPGYFDFYFVGEHLRRAFEVSYSHGEPFYFYVPVLLGGLLPWSLLVPFLTWRRLEPNPARRFCVTAVVTTSVVFSGASAKLIPYILPALPPIAILIADGIISCAWPPGAHGRAVSRPDSRILAESGPLLGILGALAIAAGIFAPRFGSPYPLYVQRALLGVGGVLVAGGAIVTALFLGRLKGAGIAALVLTMALALMGASWARVEAEPLRSYAILAREIALRAPDATVICYHRYVQALPFYTRKRVVLVGARTELGFGSRLAPEAGEYFLRNDVDLLRLWQTPGRKVLVLDETDLARLKEQLGAFTVIGAEFHKRAIEKPGERADRE